MATALKNQKEGFLGKAAGKSCGELATVAAPQKQGLVVGRFRFTGCPPAFRRCTNTLMVYTGVATKVISSIILFHNKKIYEILYIEKALSLFLNSTVVNPKNLHTYCTANKFGIMYSRKRISQNSFPNFIYIFPKSFMIFCQELEDPKRNYENQI
jgi:hypothetical protein